MIRNIAIGVLLCLLIYQTNHLRAQSIDLHTGPSLSKLSHPQLRSKALLGVQAGVIFTSALTDSKSIRYGMNLGRRGWREEVITATSSSQTEINPVVFSISYLQLPISLATNLSSRVVLYGGGQVNAHLSKRISNNNWPGYKANFEHLHSLDAGLHFGLELIPDNSVKLGMRVESSITDAICGPAYEGRQRSTAIQFVLATKLK